MRYMLIALLFICSIAHSEELDKWGKPRDWVCPICHNPACGRTQIPAVMTYDKEDMELQRKINDWGKK